MSGPKKQKAAEGEGNFADSKKLFEIENNLTTKLDTLTFSPPVQYIYSPLKYAKNFHEAFVKKYFEKSTKKILFLGMNPGPWGMCQNGIVFGERDVVKDWLKVSGSVEKPPKEHPKKKIWGLDVCRSERSGKKFWKFFQALCGTPENFFKHAFLYNFCPIAFLDESGRNITPVDLRGAAIKKQLHDMCYEALLDIIKNFNVNVVICVGEYAKKRAQRALKFNKIKNVKVLSIPHPSPLNRKKQAQWDKLTFSTLKQNKLTRYFNQDTNFVNSFLQK